MIDFNTKSPTRRWNDSYRALIASNCWEYTDWTTFTYGVHESTFNYHLLVVFMAYATVMKRLP